MTDAIFLSNRLQGARTENVIGLDSVTNYSVSESAKVTNHPVEDGSPRSDHYYIEPKTISFSGVISPWNFSGRGTDLTPADFIREVKDTMVGKVPFTLFLSDDLESVPNCVITNFEYIREVEHGKSIEVGVDLQQIKYVKRGEDGDIDRFALSEEVAEQGQETSDQGDETIRAGFVRAGDNLIGPTFDFVTGGSQ